MKNNNATTMAVSPVFPPALIPEVDSINKVCVEVPQTEATQVAIASEAIALFKPGMKFSPSF